MRVEKGFAKAAPAPKKVPLGHAAFAYRLMSVFSPIVQPGRCFDERVLYVRPLRYFRSCRRITNHPANLNE